MVSSLHTASNFSVSQRVRARGAPGAFLRWGVFAAAVPRAHAESMIPRKADSRQVLFSRRRKRYASSASLRPMSTPMAEAIIRPRVQPLESPRQWRFCTLVFKAASIFTRLL